jgi:rRNA maturation RNase YbeY
VKELFEKALRHLGKSPAEYNAEVHFVTATEIRALNKKWRGIDAPTDVLAFPLGDFNYTTLKTELGDVVICRECAGNLSEEYLFLHGLLHLMGYTHDTDEDEEKMNSVIKEVLK